MSQIPAVIMKNTVFKNVKFCGAHIGITDVGLEVTAEKAAKLSGELCALLHEQGVAASFSDDDTLVFVTAQADDQCLMNTTGNPQKYIMFRCTAQGFHVIFYP